jgi:hypothetical protein
MPTKIKGKEEPNEFPPDDESTEAEITRWRDRFKGLAEEAAKSGVYTVFSLSAYDPLSDNNWRVVAYKAPFSMAIGMAHLLIDDLQD